MRVENNAFFHCFIIVAYWLNCQLLTNEIWDLVNVKSHWSTVDNSTNKQRQWNRWKNALISTLIPDCTVCQFTENERKLLTNQQVPMPNFKVGCKTILLQNWTHSRLQWSWRRLVLLSPWISGHFSPHLWNLQALHCRIVLPPHLLLSLQSIQWHQRTLSETEIILNGLATYGELLNT